LFERHDFRSRRPRRNPQNNARPADPAAKGAARPKLLEGDTNWPAVMAALDQAGYTGWATSEQPGNQAADVAAARDLVERMDRIIAL
jgi:hexulose-6-phosphate isomerase